jgi:predicted nucleic acid-binding protein
VTAYLDASVLLRLVLRQAGALAEWSTIRHGVASALVEVECLRTLDRLRLRADVSDRDIALRRETVFRLLEAVEVVHPTRAILARAAQPVPTDLGTLDAIHLLTGGPKPESASVSPRVRSYFSCVGLWISHRMAASRETM